MPYTGALKLKKPRILSSLPQTELANPLSQIYNFQRACMNRLIDVDETRELSHVRSKWRSIPTGKGREHMYVC